MTARHDGIAASRERRRGPFSCCAEARRRDGPGPLAGTACDTHQAVLCLPTFSTVSCILCCSLPSSAPPAARKKAASRSRSFTFNGVKAVTGEPAEVRARHQASSKLPWGEKRYFSREQFEADLKRIAAFYNDRGFPDARVDLVRRQAERRSDLRRHHDQHRRRGAARGRADRVRGLRDPAAAAPARARARAAAEAGPAARPGADAGEPRGGARRAEGSRLPVRVGAGHAKRPERSERQRVADASTPSRVRWRIIGADRDPGQLERQRPRRPAAADVPPGELFQQSKLLDSQRHLYGLELFQFANVEPVGPKARSRPRSRRASR